MEASGTNGWSKKEENLPEQLLCTLTVNYYHTKIPIYKISYIATGV